MIDSNGLCARVGTCQGKDIQQLNAFSERKTGWIGRLRQFLCSADIPFWMQTARSRLPSRKASFAASISRRRQFLFRLRAEAVNNGVCNETDSTGTAPDLDDKAPCIPELPQGPVKRMDERDIIRNASADSDVADIAGQPLVIKIGVPGQSHFSCRTSTNRRPPAALSRVNLATVPSGRCSIWAKRAPLSNAIPLDRTELAVERPIGWVPHLKTDPAKKGLEYRPSSDQTASRSCSNDFR